MFCEPFRNGLRQNGQPDRLAEHPVGPHFHRFFANLFIECTAHQNKRNVTRFGFQLSQQLKARNAGHVDVDER